MSTIEELVAEGFYCRVFYEREVVEDESEWEVILWKGNTWRDHALTARGVGVTLSIAISEAKNHWTVLEKGL